MAGTKIRLRIVSPSRKLFDEDVDMLIVRTTEGDMGILPGHQTLTAILSYGRLKIVRGEETLVAAVLGGFVEVQPDSVTLLSDAAEWPDEIDVNRAEAAKERAERRLRQQSIDVDVQRASLALRRALVRMEVSSYPLIHAASKIK